MAPARLDKSKVFEALIELHEAALRVCRDNVLRFQHSTQFANASASAHDESARIEEFLNSYRPVINSQTVSPAAGAEGTIVVMSSAYPAKLDDRRTSYFLIASKSLSPYLKVGEIPVDIRVVGALFFGNRKLGETFVTSEGRPGEEWDMVHEIVDLY